MVTVRWAQAELLHAADMLAGDKMVAAGNMNGTAVHSVAYDEGI